MCPAQQVAADPEENLLDENVLEAFKIRHHSTDPKHRRAIQALVGLDGGRLNRIRVRGLASGEPDADLRRDRLPTQAAG